MHSSLPVATHGKLSSCGGVVRQRWADPSPAGAFAAEQDAKALTGWIHSTAALAKQQWQHGEGDRPESSRR